uniref:Zona pellucida glycoprotein 3f, tandem duplicate 2 n=1 Tax=Neogobius melanostomus TaxID=47308 RepID=A0A8C6U924_9GOBI
MLHAFFLGNCKPSDFDVLPSGEGELLFRYRFAECKFTQQTKGKHIIFDNELTFRPQQKGNPAIFVHPVQCVTKRSDSWVPQFLNPGAGTSEACGGLLFHMALLNAELTGISQNNLVPLGSFMPILASVDQESHQPLLLLMEECIAAATPKLYADSQVYPLISNKGCLEESKRGNAVFLPRYHSSSLILYLQSVEFGLGQEAYIHCKLVAWDPDHIDKTKKACYYSRENERV